MKPLALAVPQSGSLETYIQAVSSIDMLTAEERQRIQQGKQSH